MTVGCCPLATFESVLEASKNVEWEGPGDPILSFVQMIVGNSDADRSYLPQPGSDTCHFFSQPTTSHMAPPASKEGWKCKRYHGIFGEHSLSDSDIMSPALQGLSKLTREKKQRSTRKEKLVHGFV